MKCLLIAAITALLVTSSCSIAPYAGMDQSRYRSAGTDWEMAQELTGIPEVVIDNYRNNKDTRPLPSTRVISSNFSGSGIYVADFSPECDQQENRPPAFQIKTNGPITVRNLYFKGTGHDGFHIHSGKYQGWNSKEKVSQITFEKCIFSACEDALTVGFKTRDITFRNCIFVANPDGKYRDKLVQLNHADGVRFVNCYFSPTRNGVEFKSGANISAQGCIFDRCSTAWRVRTGDDYRGIIPDQPTRLQSKGCTYRFAKQAFFLQGTVAGESIGDQFPGSRVVVTRREATFSRR